MNLVLKLSKTDEELNKLNKVIFNLSTKLRAIPGGKELENLRLLHRLSQNDIFEYKERIKVLEENIKLNSEIIYNLRKKNEYLKKNKKIEKYENIPTKAKNINDIAKKFGIISIRKFIPSESKVNFNKKEIKKDQIPIAILEGYLKEKKKFEKIFEDLKIKCNAYYNEENKQKEIINNYTILIDEIKNEIQIIDNNFNIKYDNININLNDEKKILEEICLKVGLLSSSLMELKDINIDVKNFSKFENILNDIYNNISKINKKEYDNENSLAYILKEIKISIQELQNICFLVSEKINEFNNKNTSFQKELEELKKIYKKYKNENIKRNESIRISLIQKHTNVNNTRILNNNQEMNNINLNNNSPIAQTILIRPKSSKEDLYKTTALFSKEQEEKQYQYPQLLEKNWHEICYVYDNYDIYDVYYTLKSVGLQMISYFDKSIFYIKDNSIVELFTINEEKKDFKNNGYYIEFKINLKNSQTAKIHIKYKHNKDRSGKNKKFDFEEWYGISAKLNKKCIGKFILILKGNFDIIHFSDDFLVKNQKNKADTEYVWGGLIPSNGKMTSIKFTRKKTKWSANYYIKTIEINGSNNFNHFTYYVDPIFFYGNNNIIDFKITSPQTKDIIYSEEDKKFIINYKNNRIFEINYQVTIENNSKPGWIIDLTDEEIKKLMPKEDVRDANILKPIAKKIVENFDKMHKNSEFIYYDFMKIGEWVNKNITYDITYSGRLEYTAIDIYNNKRGVCHHFTRLSNALLYSLGYQVLYTMGYCANYTTENIFNNKDCHAWSLIKIGNLWFPFDSTWGLLKGRVPITHIFANVNLTNSYRCTYSNSGCGLISYDKCEMQGKYIE